MSAATSAAPWPKRRASWPIPVLILLSLPVFYYNLGNYGLVNGDEGFFHRSAANMVKSGDWLTIQWNGEHRIYETFLGSPIQVWMRAALISVGGYNYWTMRLISATCGMLAVLCTYWLSRRFMAASESFLAAILLMFSFHFVFLHGARTGEMDAILTLVFVWTALTFVRALRENRSFIPHHLGLMVLICVKLPLIVVPLAFEATYFALVADHRRHVKRWVLAMAWIGPIGISWHVYQFFSIGPKTVMQVFALMSDQAAGVRGQVQDNAGLSLLSGVVDRAAFYGRILLFGGYPYIVLVPIALIAVWRRKASRRTTDYWRVIIFLPLTLLVFYVLISRRQPWYVLPVYPFAAILVARLLYRLDGLWRGVAATGVLGLAGALSVALTFRPAVRNPFKMRAMVITPESFLSDVHIAGFGWINWWVYVPILALVLAILVALLRKVSHWTPVRLVPALCILIVVGVAGARIAGALQYTNYLSDTERFARRLARRTARSQPITFPINVPPVEGDWSGRQIHNYYFGHLYEVETRRKRTQLIRRLRPEERPSLRREDLTIGLGPSRGVLKGTDQDPDKKRRDTTGAKRKKTRQKGRRSAQSRDKKTASEGVVGLGLATESRTVQETG